MEEWQQECINQNIYQLVGTTRCEVDIVDYLKGESMLSEIEAQILKNESITTMEKVSKMYDILKTRVGAYEKLKEGLRLSRQNGVLRILSDAEEGRSQYMKYGTLEITGNREGGSPMVFEGTFATRPVIVKVVNNVNQSIPEHVSNELKILAQLDWHENIVRCLVGKFVWGSNLVTGNQFAIALEYNCNLADYVHDKYPTSVRANLNSIKARYNKILSNQILEGVKFLHQRNIVHLNIRPESIFLKYVNGVPEKAKIGELGYSAELSNMERKNFLFPNLKNLAVANTPEVLQIQDGVHNEYELENASVELDISTDAICLGLTIYYCLSGGRNPFGGLISWRSNMIANILAIDQSCLCGMLSTDNFLALLKTKPVERFRVSHMRTFFQTI